MPSKPFMFGTNFKMHQTPAESRVFVSELRRRLSGLTQAQFFLIPPFTSLPGLAELADPVGIWIGAQNMHYAEQGAFTGEISARMLKACGVHLVMLGHAERRQLFGETDALLYRKVQIACEHGLRVLLCVGENLDEKTFGVTAEIVARQLKVALHNYPRDFLSRLMIAYEPVWSIGESGTPAPALDVAQAAAHIREALGDLFGEGAVNIPLLYGGSVNQANCGEYAALTEIDGLFVGRAAWQVGGFVEVFRAGFSAYEARVV